MAAHTPDSHDQWHTVDPNDRVPVPPGWIPFIPVTLAAAMIVVGWAILSILRP